MITAEEYERALIAPEEVFRNPMDVVNEKTLTPIQRLKLLKHWEVNSHDLAVATEEGLTGPGQPRLDEVKKAIIKICEMENLDESSAD